jgi:oxygen-independent coproporphyrinogen-3 oxidase
MCKTGMRGLYIHIPFCKQACRYCDFCFYVSLHYMDELVDRLVDEMEIKGKKSGVEVLDTLYLGGGTPSLLHPRHLEKILNTAHRLFSFRDTPEITMECNPDDLDREYLSFLWNSGINRLSIGIQSFRQTELNLMRRTHSVIQATRSVMEAAGAGFTNITVDLIYGVPGQTAGAWESNVRKAISLPVEHISAYHLTYESGTVFDHWRKKGRITPVPEELSIEQYRIMRQLTAENGFDHYEISNFARKGSYSEHNMLYWSGKPYIGIGPSAHSFDGKNRNWNISSLKKYMELIRQGDSFTESEHLTRTDQYHDTLITALRTRQGIDPGYIEKRFGTETLQHFLQKSASFLERGVMVHAGPRIAIHPDHWFISDYILRELFMENH